MAFECEPGEVIEVSQLIDYMDTKVPLDGDDEMTGNLIIKTENDSPAVILQDEEGRARAKFLHNRVNNEVGLMRMDPAGTINSNIILGVNKVSIGGTNGVYPVVTEDQDIATKKYVDDNLEIIDRAHNDLEGREGINSHPTSAITGLDSALSTISAHSSLTENPHEVTAAQTGALPTTGGTMTGELIIKNPVNNNNAAHKEYVDQGDAVKVNNTDGVHGTLATITTLTQAEYDAISAPDNTTMYLVDGGNVKSLRVGNAVFAYHELNVDYNVSYTFTADNTGWEVAPEGNIVINSGDAVNGDVFASNHVHLEGAQSIDVPSTGTLTKSVTYYSVADKSFKINSYEGSTGENLVQNGDFSSGFDNWTPDVGDDHDWTIATPDGAQLDLRVKGTFAVCTADLTSPILAGETFMLSYSTEIVDDNGDGEENLFTVQLNTNEISKWTRDGDHEYMITHENDIDRIRLSRTGPVFTGVYRNIEIKKVGKFTVDESCSSIFKLNKIPVNDDITYLNANPNSIVDMLNDTPHPGLSFDKQDIIDGGGYYPCDDGILGNKNIKNIVDASPIEIKDYAAKCRTELVNTRDGANALRVTKSDVDTTDRPRGFPWASVTVEFDAISSDSEENFDLIERLGDININAVGIHFAFGKIMSKYNLNSAEAVAFAFTTADAMIEEIRDYNQANGRNIVVKIKVEDTPHDSAECQERTAPAFWAEDAPCKEEMITFVGEFVEHFRQFDEVVYYKFIAEPRYYPNYPDESPVESPPGWDQTLADIIAAARTYDANCWIGLSLSKGGNPLNQVPTDDPYPDDKVIYTYSNWIPFAYTVQGTDGNDSPVYYPGNIGGDYWDIDQIRATFADVITFQQTNNVLISASVGAVNFAPGKDQFIEDVVNVYKENGFGRSTFNGASSKAAPYDGFNIFYDGTYNVSNPDNSTFNYLGAESPTAIMMTELNKDTLDRIEATGVYKNITTDIACFDGTGQVIETHSVVDGTTNNFLMAIAFTIPENRGAESWGHILSSSSSQSNRIAVLYSDTMDYNTVRVQIGQYFQDIDFNPENKVHAICTIYNKSASTLQLAVDGATLPAAIPIVFDDQTDPIFLGASKADGTQPYKGFLVGPVMLSIDENITDINWQSYWTDYWTGVKDVVIPG